MLTQDSRFFRGYTKSYIYCWTKLVSNSQIVINVLQDQQDDEIVWDELFEMAKEVAVEWNIDRRTPRLTANQQQRVNVPANTPKQQRRKHSTYF